ALAGGPFDFRQPTGWVELRDVSTGRTYRRLEGVRGAVSCLAFAPDGKTLAGGCVDFSIALWDVHPPAGGEAKKEPEKPRRMLTGHAARVTAVAFSLDGKLLAGGSADGAVRLFDPLDGAASKVALEGHTGPVGGLLFHPDGKRLISSCQLVIGVW